MHSSLIRIFLGLFLLGAFIVPAQALLVNGQNQLFAQSGEKITVTYVSVSSAHRGELCNVFTPTVQVSIDTRTTTAGKTIDLGSYSANTEVVLQLLNPNTGFSLFNDARNNMDLENHIQFTSLGDGKYLAGWKIGESNASFNDLVLLVQATPATHANAPQKAAASDWNLYE